MAHVNDSTGTRRQHLGIFSPSERDGADESGSDYAELAPRYVPAAEELPSVSEVSRFELVGDGGAPSRHRHQLYRYSSLTWNGLRISNCEINLPVHRVRLCVCWHQPATGRRPWKIIVGAGQNLLGKPEQ